jgi:drug/metabolite transporter (DMT)-like permease
MAGGVKAQAGPAKAGLPAFGIVLTILVAVSFAVNSTLAAIAYEHGANPLSALTLRTAAAAVAVFIILRLWRVPVDLSPRARLTAIGLGGFLAAYSYGVLGAIEHMPVALVVLTFYLYPMLTGFGVWLTGQEPITTKLVIALLAAFAGLALALDVFGQTVSFTGIAMAAGAAIVITVMILIMNPMVKGKDSRPVSLYMLSSGACVFLIIDMIAGEFALPQTLAGGLAFAGVGAFYSFSIIGIFVAISKIGAVRVSLLMNFEPLTSVILGVLLLDQILSTVQFLGAAIVIAAITFAAFTKGGMKEEVPD